jgi:hypothetical protein
MTITQEQVADLHPGDVVELRLDEWPPGQAIRGPLVLSKTYPGVLEIQIPGHASRYWVRTENRGPFNPGNRTLTVVSRAPKPLYVNHTRTEPVPGDVVRAAEGDGSETYHYVRIDFGAPWGATTGGKRYPREHIPARLRLLVDGETGMTVPQ